MHFGMLKFLFILTLFPVLANAHGGMDLGGGDTLVGDPITFEQFEKIVSLYQSKRAEIFRGFELTALLGRRILNVEAKLTRPLSAGEKQDALVKANLGEALFTKDDRNSILAAAVIEIRKNEPCYDEEKNEKDASIYGRSKGVVCFSWKRMRPKLRDSNYEIQLLGLYSHEVSHLLGANESDAVTLQNLVLDIGPNFKNYFSYLFLPKQKLEQRINEIHELALKIRPLTDSTDTICSSVTEIYKKTYQLFVDSNLSTQEIVTLDFPAIFGLHASLVASGLSADFCLDDQNFIKQQLKIKFKNNDRSTIGNLYPDPLGILPIVDQDQVLKLSQYLLADLANESVAFPGYHDRKALRQNLDVLVRRTK